MISIFDGAQNQLNAGLRWLVPPLIDHLYAFFNVRGGWSLLKRQFFAVFRWLHLPPFKRFTKGVVHKIQYGMESQRTESSPVCCFASAGSVIPGRYQGEHILLNTKGGECAYGSKRIG